MTIPVNTVPPALTALPTPAVLGSVLTTDNGTWTNAVSFTVAWARAGVVISGATGNTYTVRNADIGSAISALVTAIGSPSTDTATAPSNASQTVPGTLVVEDGSGLANSEAYCAVAFAAKYNDQRGHLEWFAASLGGQESALRQATEFMSQRYRLRWLGNRVTITQALDWPRYSVPIPDSPGGYRGYPAVYPPNVVPLLVQQACAELAWRVTKGLTLQPDLTDRVKTKKVGPIEVVYEFGSQEGVSFRSVDLMLRTMLNPSSYFPVARG